MKATLSFRFLRTLISGDDQLPLLRRLNLDMLYGGADDGLAAEDDIDDHHDFYDSWESYLVNWTDELSVDHLRRLRRFAEEAGMVLDGGVCEAFETQDYYEEQLEQVEEHEHEQGKKYRYAGNGETTEEDEDEEDDDEEEEEEKEEEEEEGSGSDEGERVSEVRGAWGGDGDLLSDLSQ